MEKDFVVDKNFDRHLYDILISEHGILLLESLERSYFKQIIQINGNRLMFLIRFFFRGYYSRRQYLFFWNARKILSTSLVSFLNTMLTARENP